MSERGVTLWRVREPGFALPAVLLLLVAIGLVGAAAVALTSSETRVSGLYNFSNRAASAAVGGLEHAVTHFGTEGPDSGWPVTGEVGGFDYEVTIARDSFDFGSGDLPVSWNSADGYNTDDDGAPVWVLEATASRGAIEAAQTMRVSTAGGTLVSDAPFSASSSLRLRGQAEISGIDVSGDPSCSDKPAVVLTDGDDDVDVGGGAELEGGDEYAGNDPPYVETDPALVFNTPEEVLGLSPGALDNRQQTPAEFNADPVDPLEGVVYVTGNFGTSGAGSNDIGGSGILIVHNPLYDPREHDPDHALYDPAKAANPLYGPARLGNITTGTFEGIVIADTIDKLTSTAEIHGSVIMLRRTDDGNNIMTGKARVQYSCQSIQAVLQQVGGPRRLSWTTR